MFDKETTFDEIVDFQDHIMILGVNFINSSIEIHSTCDLIIVESHSPNYVFSHGQNRASIKIVDLLNTDLVYFLALLKLHLLECSFGCLFNTSFFPLFFGLPSLLFFQYCVSLMKETSNQRSHSYKIRTSKGNFRDWHVLKHFTNCNSLSEEVA